MMSNYDDLLLDFDYISEDTIVLEPDLIQQAAEFGSQIVKGTGQWQTYLNALALYGFEEWLKERASELPINVENCSVIQPAVASAIEAVCHLQVGNFQLCLLATGSSIEDVVVLPRAAIELPEYTAHFYVAIAVQEELEQARIQGFIAYDDLLTQLQSNNLSPENDWTYQLPIAWFEANADRLLLYLRCLETRAISLPVIPTNRAIAVEKIREKIISVIPQLQSGNYSLWQLFDWEQGALLLTNPQLLRWLYRLQREPELLTREDRTSIVEQLSQILTSFSQQVVNVGLWLQNELDEIAQNIAWTLLPPPALATVALRSIKVTATESVTEEFRAIIAELRGTELEVPQQARGAYLDFNLADNTFRLYAITWLSSSDEWTLLLVLGLSTSRELPPGIQLQISDRDGVLFEQLVKPDDDDVYLYASTIGHLSEEFLAQISCQNGEEIRFNFLFEL